MRHSCCVYQTALRRQNTVACVNALRMPSHDDNEDVNDVDVDDDDKQNWRNDQKWEDYFPGIKYWLLNEGK